MKSCPAVLAILVVLLYLPTWAGGPPGQQATSPGNSRFIDLDGDGLNDNIPDQDNDGIPDFKRNEPSQPRLTMRGVTDIFKGLEAADAPTKLSLSNSDRFRVLRFYTRSLSQCRGGFTSGDEFGPGNGIGQGALAGNCVGGICRF